MLISFCSKKLHMFTRHIVILGVPIPYYREYERTEYGEKDFTENV